MKTEPEIEPEPIPAPEKKTSPLKFILIIGGLVVFMVIIKFIFDGVRLASSCRVQSADYIDQLDPLYDDWYAAVLVANESPRKDVGTAIAELKFIRSEIYSLSPPDCADDLHVEMLGHMNALIAAFEAFQDNKPDSDVQKLADQSQEHLSNFTTLLDELK